MYHREIHSSTGRTPLEAWKDIDKVGPKLPPPRELLAPLVGFTPYRKLQRDGVRFNRLRWNSNGFQALRASSDCPKDVLIRIDPHDLRTAYVLDENTGVWIEGELQSESEVENLTLAQYEHLRVKSRELAPVDLDEQLDIARARQEIFDFVADR
ncbi:Mu transposase C-terminal domain-containing protein, partial [Aureimonas leprariae]